MKRNVLLIIPDYGFGGAERSFAKLSKELSKKHDVYIALFNTEKQCYYELTGKVIDLKVKAGTTIVGKIIQFWKRVNRLKKVKKKYRINISISFLEGADYVNYFSRVKDRIILSIRGSKLNDETINGFLGIIRKKLLIPFIYKKADLVVTLNDGIKEELRKVYKIPYHIPIKTIYNYYDIDCLVNQSMEKIPLELKVIFENNKVIVSHGRLAPEKGFVHLIRIFAIIKQKCHNCKLLIIGDGPTKEALFSLCEEYNLKYYNWESHREINSKFNVYFVGYQPNPLKFLKRSSIFVLMSSSEGFGNSIAEAMAAGLAVLSTDCPSGPREILAPNTLQIEHISKPEYANYGILMPLIKNANYDSSINLWGETIINLLKDEILLKHYSNKARERINDFSKEIIFPQWQQLLEEGY